MSLGSNKLIRFDDFEIDLGERTLWRDGSLVVLPPKVMETLCLLVENHGRLLTKDQLIDRLWPETFVEERNLTQNIFRIRKALGDGSEGRKYIETLPRRGYRFVADVRPVEPETEAQVAEGGRATTEELVSSPDLTEAVKRSDGTVASQTTVDARRSDPGRSEARSFPTRRIMLLTAGIAAIFLFAGIFFYWQGGTVLDRFANSTNSTRGVLNFERLTDSGKAFYPVVSPNGQFFAYVFIDRGKHSVELQNIATGSKTLVVGPTDAEIAQPRFSPDGNHLFFRQTETKGDSGTAYRVPILGGAPRSIVAEVNSDFSISPDGEWLSFVRFKPDIDGQQLIVCRSLDGSEERAVATRTHNESFAVWGYYPAWTPDGKKVIARLLAKQTDANPGPKTEGLGLINIENGDFEPLRTPKWSSYSQVEWMPDGQSMIFLAREHSREPMQVWQVSYPSGDGKQLTNDAHDYGYFSISPDGEFLLTTQTKTFLNLWSIPVADPMQAKQLTYSSELRLGERGVDWTPDGKHLVYTRAENSVDANISKINVETFETHQLTFDERGINWYPRVMRDGSGVIFASNRKSGTHIWQMDLNGDDLRQITDGPGESFPSVTADGKWLIYASPAWEPDALWKRSLTDGLGEPLKILSTAAGSNSVSLDGGLIAVSYRSVTEKGKLEFKYGLVPAEPTEIPEALDFNPFFGAIAWKLDGNGFFYIKDQGRSLNNIWFYDLRSKNHRQITNFSDRMFSLALSPDGTTLATARGATVSNVFKISGYR